MSTRSAHRRDSNFEFVFYNFYINYYPLSINSFCRGAEVNHLYCAHVSFQVEEVYSETSVNSETKIKFDRFLPKPIYKQHHQKLRIYVFLEFVEKCLRFIFHHHDYLYIYYYY